MERREFLAGLAAVGATALVPDFLQGAQTRPRPPRRRTASTSTITATHPASSPQSRRAIRARPRS